MKAFKNNPVLRATLISRAAQHRINDEYRKGTYYLVDEMDNFRACSIGCIVQDLSKMYDFPSTGEALVGYHKDLESLLGIHEEVWTIVDDLFESLPTHLAVLWTERVLNAIKLGADTNNVEDILLDNARDAGYDDTRSMTSLLNCCRDDQVPEIADIFIEVLESCA